MEETVTIAEKYIDIVVQFALENGFRLLGGIVVLIVGFWVTKIITRSIGKGLARLKIDQSLIPFLKSLSGIILKILVVITVMGMIGIQMTSFIAVLGAVGLAIGLALSGTLQNFAGGVIILVMKPYKLGDFIEAQGYKGVVKEINVFATVLNTVDNKRIIIPNGPLSTDSLTNFSAEPIRRVDWKFGMAYGDKVGDFKKALNDFIQADERILKEPESFIGLSELADSSVNFAVRAWVKTEDYWSVFFEMNEKVYNKFGDYELNIPFPQMDVHVHKVKKK